MMRSMFSGVSGLQTHQTGMDVIGDNISNVNTVGFKGSRATFADMMSQTLQPAQGPNDRGGINPQQVGMGVGLASIDTDISQGSLESTGNSTDLAVEGDGYFVVNDGTEDYYTRAGNFSVDENGNLVSSTNGFQVQGWMAEDGELPSTTADQMEEINVYDEQIMMGDATTEAEFSGNLDANALRDAAEEEGIDMDDYDFDEYGPHELVTLDIYDSQGGTATITFGFEQTDYNEWTIHYGEGDNWEEDWEELDDIEFDSSGNLESVGGDDDEDSFTLEDLSDFLDNGAEYGAIDEDGDFEDEIEIDLSGLTQVKDDFSAEATATDGVAYGYLDDFEIAGDGAITGTYTNGESQTLAQIALADFENPAGLEQVGDNIMTTSQNSGEASISTPGATGMGDLSAGTLEMSNVDLSQEFTKMIQTQRGFQANSASITTSDEMLQELVNLKR